MEHDIQQDREEYRRRKNDEFLARRREFVEGAISPGLAAQLEILSERAAQESEFGNDADDRLEPAEWIARLAKHLGKAVTTEPDVYRRQLVVLGALAISALEAHDRRFR